MKVDIWEDRGMWAITNNHVFQINSIHNYLFSHPCLSGHYSFIQPSKWLIYWEHSIAKTVSPDTETSSKWCKGLKVNWTNWSWIDFFWIIFGSSKVKWRGRIRVERKDQGWEEASEWLTPPCEFRAGRKYIWQQWQRKNGRYCMSA